MQGRRDSRSSSRPSRSVARSSSRSSASRAGAESSRPRRAASSTPRATRDTSRARSSRPDREQGRHATAQGGGSRASMNASGLDLSSNRKKKKADRGYVDYLTPTTKSGESDKQFSRRASRMDFSQGVQRKSNIKHFALLALMALIIVGVGIAVGVTVYFGQSNSKLSFEDESVVNALVEPAEGEAYYALCVAELGTYLDPNEGAGDAYLLVRIDEANKALTFVGIPANLAVKYSDGSTHALYEVLDSEGDAALITQVSQFADVPISHYAHTNAEGIAKMVEKLGGLQVNLTEEVDDPTAGILYLQAGERTLDADGVLALLRASNFSNGIETQNKNRIDVMVQMASAALSADGLSFASELASMADSVQTSWKSSALMDLGELMRPLEEATIYQACVPGYASGRLYVDSTAKWTLMMQNVGSGLDPYAEAATVTNVDRAAITVEVRNGGGVTGAGAKMGELITAYGYQLGEVGNTEDGTVYPETFVLYKDAVYADAAEAMVGDIGVGRVVNGGDFYTFETNLLVIVGKDWMPAA